ncbi:MAG: ribosome recycling factor [Alphaproteobacteria bacterium]|nr:ribosome recycling factor [Alphaproteobacteria bacterium]
MSEPDDFDLKSYSKRMDGAVQTLRQEFSGLRTGRASASLVEPVTVEAYGSTMPLNQVATISVPESRMITVGVWDKGLVSAVEKAIRSSGLGLNPSTDGTTIRLSIPELNEERRQELTKIAAKYAESARVAVRNIRRDGIEKLRKLEKDGELSEDELKRLTDEMQALTDRHVNQIDEALKTKEAEIMQV